MSDKPTNETREIVETNADSDPFDPERFGNIGFTTGFFRQLITTRLPEPKAEDLVDSVPPGEGPAPEEVKKAASLYLRTDPQKVQAQLASSDRAGDPDATLEKSFFLSPEESMALGDPSRKKNGWMAFFLVSGLAGVMVMFLWWVSEKDALDVEGRARDAGSKDEVGAVGTRAPELSTEGKERVDAVGQAQPAKRVEPATAQRSSTNPPVPPPAGPGKSSSPQRCKVRKQIEHLGFEHFGPENVRFEHLRFEHARFERLGFKKDGAVRSPRYRRVLIIRRFSFRATVAQSMKPSSAESAKPSSAESAKPSSVAPVSIEPTQMFPVKSMLFFLSLFLWITPAWSEENSPRERGRELLEQGFAADKAGDTERAVELYEQSFELYPSYDVAGNLGVLEVKLERYAAAANHLSYCLRHFPTGESAKLRTVIEKNLASAERYVGSVVVQVDEPSADITIAKQVIGTSPLNHEYYLVPGKYGVRAATETRYAEAIIEVEQGERTEVTLELTPNPPAATAAPNTSGGSSKPPEAHKSVRPASLVPAYVLGGLSLATLASSVALRAVAGSKKRKAEDLHPDSDSGCESMGNADCNELSRLIGQHDDFARASNVTMIVGAVGAAATIGYLTYALIQRHRAAPLQPSVGADRHGATLFLSGQF